MKITKTTSTKTLKKTTFGSMKVGQFFRENDTTGFYVKTGEEKGISIPFGQEFYFGNDSALNPVKVNEILFEEIFEENFE